MWHEVQQAWASVPDAAVAGATPYHTLQACCRQLGWQWADPGSIEARGAPGRQHIMDILAGDRRALLHDFREAARDYLML